MGGILMEKPKLKERDRRLISFFFSIIIISSVIGIVEHLTHDIFYTTTTQKGMVSGFTSDSVYVYIPWLVEYEHSKKFTEQDITEIKTYVIELMGKDLKKEINSMTYETFMDISKQEIRNSKNGVTIIIFNNLKN